MAGGASFQQNGFCEWFFRGNKLMFSSRMKKHLKEICGCVLPEIPFFFISNEQVKFETKWKDG
jgi:hypothetical protein